MMVDPTTPPPGGHRGDGRDNLGTGAGFSQENSPGAVFAPGAHFHDSPVHTGDINHNYATDLSPTEAFDRARRCLERGLRERADDLLRQALESLPRGVTTRVPGGVAPARQEVLYAALLTLVSGRSIEELGPLLARFREHLRELAEFPAGDPYRAAGEALGRIVRAAGSGGGEPVTESVLLDKRLTPALRKEIADHVTALRADLVREEAEHAERERLRATRAPHLVAEREYRVPIFFLPDAVEPRRPAGEGPPGGRLPLVLLVPGGLILAVGWLSVLGAGADAGGWWVPVVGVFGWALVFTCALRVHWYRDRARKLIRWQRLGVARTRRYSWRGTGASPWDERGPELRKLISRRFRDRLRDDPWCERWMHDSAPTRKALLNEWCDLYAEEKVPADHFDWLAQWQAERTEAEWRAGRLSPPPQEAATPAEKPGRKPEPLPPGTTPGRFSLGRFVGWALLGVVAFHAVPELVTEESVGTLATLLCVLALGRACTVYPARRLYGRRRHRIADEKEFEERHSEEMSRYEEWVEYLAARPSDEEMEIWLYQDTRRLRHEYLAHHDRRATDAFFDFFLLERAPGSLAARVAGCPPRYSGYIVRYFMLSRSGVWMGRWEVDFRKGTHSGREDETFRYAKLTTVKIVREGGDPEQATPQYRHIGGRAVRLGPAGLRQSLHVRLENGDSLDVRAEDFSDFGETVGAENPERLEQLALESSGIRRASDILAAVTAEGVEWFEEQRRRALELPERPDPREERGRSTELPEQLFVKDIVDAKGLPPGSSGKDEPVGRGPDEEE
ncbi:hypothetical protein FNQ90_10565 [Streptomyces alkaliphilus]|uniref:Uncharacterized protein n=1 Tax=Streptomyces alkaliphilus TaxID=1472722 RepID=A0A7W3TD90_9ACTN|nr:hypothetical protein [Streptomyces alkaliphilus]MBB0244535.1 hypothetical protein [Streptomyces alkaliphilus]